MAELISRNGAALLWFLAAIGLLATEIATVQLVSIWFCLGAVAATMAALWGCSGTSQLLVFFLVSAVALAATRPLVGKVLHFRKVPTNADSIIGMSGPVLEEINNTTQTGRVRVNGLDWSARSCDGQPIQVGATIVVESIQGVKLMVRLQEATAAGTTQAQSLSK